MRVQSAKKNQSQRLGRYKGNWFTSIIAPLSPRERIIYGLVIIGALFLIVAPRITATQSIVGSQLVTPSGQCTTNGDWLFPERAIGQNPLFETEIAELDINASASSATLNGSLICGGFLPNDDTRLEPAILISASVTNEQTTNTTPSITLDSTSQTSNQPLGSTANFVEPNALSAEQAPSLDNLFEVSVSSDNGASWQQLHIVETAEELQNNPLLAIALPTTYNSRLDDLSVRITPLTQLDEGLSLAIDSIGVTYEVGEPIAIEVDPVNKAGEALGEDQPTLSASKQIDFQLTSKLEGDGLLQGLGRRAQDIVADESAPELTVDVQIVDRSTATETSAQAEIDWQEHALDGSNVWDITLQMPNAANPGSYSAVFDVTDESGVTKTIQQDFLWGVLALNYDQSVYEPNTTAMIAMTVLNPLGETVCDAEVSLSIEGPQGYKQAFATYADTVSISQQCAVYGSQLVPDYLSEVMLGSVGEYELTMTAVTDEGSYTIVDVLNVEREPDFVIARTGPTRVYPPITYPYTLDVTANEAFSGVVTETLPASFEITEALFAGSYDSITESDDSIILSWNVELAAGETKRLGYQFKAPPISPEFYLLGPSQLLDGQQVVYEESRSWQLAGDAVDVFRSTTYEIEPGQFTGTDYTLTLNNNLYRDYFAMIVGPSSATGSRGPDDDGVRVVSDPHANYAASVNANELSLRRGSADNDWTGAVTVVECTSDCQTQGFELKEVREVVFATGPGNALQTVTDTLTDNHTANTVPFAGRQGGGFEITGGASNNNYATTLGVKVEKIGTNQIQYERYGAVNRAPYGGTMTSYIVEWGSNWNVQTANVTGNNVGNGINAAGEYDTTALGSSVTRDDTWLWGGGYSTDDGLGDGALGQVLALGNGVVQNVTETTVAVGGEVGIAGTGRDFQIYVMEHADATIDHRFKADGNSGNTIYTSAIDAAVGTETYDNTATDVRFTEGSRFALANTTSNGAGQAYSRTGAWGSRPTANTTNTWWRTYSGQNFAGWLQVVDFDNITGTTESIEQLHFRWRDDSVDLNTGGGWLAAEDANAIGSIEKEENLRLRIEVAATNAGSDSLLRTYQLQYGDTMDGTGTCGAITTWSPVGSGAAFELFDSANIASDGEATTGELLSNTESYSFYDGEGRDVTDTTALPSLPLAGNSFREFEYSLRPTYDAITGHTYCFRLFDTNNATTLTAYSVFPEITIDSVVFENFIGEYGSVSLTADNYSTVNFTETYTNPIVVASPRYNPSTQVARSTRVTNKTATGFDVKVDNAAGSVVGSTDVDWMVFEQGSYALDNGSGTQQVEAGTQSVSNVVCRGNFSAGSGSAITFSSPFASTPAVLHTVASDIDTSWTSSHINDGVSIDAGPTTTGFEISLNRSYESCTHSAESVDYIAIEQGHGTNNGVEFDAVVSPDATDCCTAGGTITNFSSAFATPPETHVVSQNGEDAAGFDINAYGPLLWLDSDDDSTVTHTSGSVSQWDDKSGNGNSFVQATGTTQPQRIAADINGRDIIRFDGTDDVLQDPNGIFGTGAALTDFVFFVVYKDNILGVNDAVFRHDVTGDQIAALSPWGANGFWRPGNAWQNIGAYGGDTTTYHVMRWEAYTTGGATNGVFRDGANIFNAAIAPNEVSNNGAMLIGNWTDPGNTFAKGFDIAEVVAFNNRPTAVDIAAIEAGLAAKWNSGVDGSFAASHTGTATTTAALATTVDEDGTGADRTHPTEVVSAIAWDASSGTILNGSFQLDQDQYRWYNNADNEIPGTAAAAEDTKLSNVASGDIVRLRVGIQVGGADLAADSLAFKLQYGENPTADCSAVASWSDLGAIGSAAIWRGVDNATPADGDSLSSSLLSGSSSTQTYEESNNTPTNVNAATKGSRTEWDWAIQQNDASGGTDYCFRMQVSDGSDIFHSQAAEIQTQARPIKQLHYRWRDDSTDVNSSGGWLAAEDASAATDPVKEEVRRIRISIANTIAVADSVARSYQLQYGDATAAGSCSAISSWNAIGVGAAFEMIGSANIDPDGEATTPGLLANTEAYAYATGEGRDIADTTLAIGPLAASSVTELEYSIRPTYDATTGTTYCFRVYDTANATALDEYANYPELTLANVSFDTILGEYGTQSLTNASYTTVTLANNYSDLVVVASPEYDPSSQTQRSVRITNKTANSFDIKVDNAAGGLTGTTAVDWLAMESGTHSVDNGGGATQFIAGSEVVSNVSCSANFVLGGTGVSFTPAFSSQPSVLHTVTTDSDTSWVASTANDGSSVDTPPSTTSLELSLNRSGASCTHSPESVDYIAVDQSHGVNDGIDFDAVVGTDNVNCCNAAGNATIFTSAFSSPPETRLISQAGEDVFDILSYAPALWLDASDVATITTAGGAVANWADKSGNGNNFVQGAGANQPVNGPDGGLGSVVIFDGIDDFLQDPNGVFGTGANITDFTVLIANKDTNLAGNNGKWRHDYTGDFHGVAAPWGGNHWVRLNAAWQNTGGYGGDITTYHVQRWESYTTGANSLAHYNDGVQLFTAATAAPFISNNGAMTIADWQGTGASAQAMNVGEVLVFDYRVGAADIAAIESYLLNKWQTGAASNPSDGGVALTHTGTAITNTTHYGSIDEFGGADRTHPSESVGVVAFDSSGGELNNGALQLDQDRYRWYDNVDSDTPATALGAENSPISNVLDGSQVRLRLGLQAGDDGLDAGAINTKLQFGQNADCSAVATWTDVGGLLSTAIWRGFDNASPADGTTLPISLLSGSPALQTYEETNNSAANPNSQASGERGEWDWVLENNGAPAATDYCFRAVKSNGDLIHYTQFARLQTETLSNTAPAVPASLVQEKTDTTNIAVGGWTDETSVVFIGDITDPDNPDDVQLCVEVQEIGTAFTDTATSCGSNVTYSGSAIAASVTIGSLTSGSEYHWQAQACDDDSACSAWVSFGGNLESARDFGIDTADPTGTVYDGSSIGIDADFNNGALDELSANWNIVDALSGIASYDYSIGTSSGATDVVGWTSNGVVASVTATSLSLNTSELYFFNIRTTDGAGNVVIISSDGIYVAPTLSFSTSPGNITFDNLNSANSYSDTKTATLTTSTNAFNGYTIRAFLEGPLTSQNADTIADFDGGTYAAPGGWLAANRGYGYTSNDNTIQGVDIFNSGCLGGGAPPCFAPFTQTPPGDIVADHTAPIVGTAVSNENFLLTHRVTVDNTQPAGVYNTTVIYVITASF